MCGATHRLDSDERSYAADSPQGPSHPLNPVVYIVAAVLVFSVAQSKEHIFRSDGGWPQTLIILHFVLLGCMSLHDVFRVLLRLKRLT